MNLSERIVQAYLQGRRIPLEGRAKLVIKDVHTGKVQIIEKHNLVTKAVADVLSKNYCGLSRFASLQPLKSLFSGCLLFQNAITEDPDNYNPPSEDVNPLIAHASQVPNDTASLLRGNPIVSDIVETDTSVRWAFSWDTSHGNGTIRSICLVPDVLGSMGLKPFNAAYNPVSSFGNDQEYNNAWSEDISKQYPFTIDEDGKTAKTIYIDGATFKEYTIRHDYLAFGIMRDSRTWQDVSTRTASVRTGNNRFIFDDDNYYYVARATSATTLQVDKVSKTDMSVTQADCTFSGVSLYTGTISGKPLNWRTFAYDGTYLYYPNAAGTGFLKLNITDNNDVTALDGEIVIDKGNVSMPRGDADQFATPLVISPGLILGNNYIINGDTVYQIKRTNAIGLQPNYNYDDVSYLDLIRSGAACYGNAKQTFYNGYWSGQSNVLVAMFLSTINNLESAVVKSTAQTMTLYYEISEVQGGD